MSIDTHRSTVFSKEFPGYQGPESRTANKCVIETGLLIWPFPASCPGDEGCNHSDVPRLSSTLGEDGARVYLSALLARRPSLQPNEGHLRGTAWET